MCPRCRSTILMIRQATGVERLMIFLTQKRKYLCPICNLSFRAPDRRRIPRDEVPAGIHLPH